MTIADRRPLQLDLIPFRIANIDRGTPAVGAIARGDLSDDGHAVSLEMALDRRAIERVDAQAEMIHVVLAIAGRRSRLPAHRPRDIEQVDQGGARPQLRQIERGLQIVDGAAEDSPVEALHRRHIAHPDDDMIETLDRKRRAHPSPRSQRRVGQV